MIIKSLLSGYIFEIMRPVIYGNAAVAKHHIQTLDEDYRNINWNLIDSPEQAKDGRLNLITCYTDNLPVQLGTPSEDANKAAKASLDRACKDLKDGKVDALVTAPLNKEALKGGTRSIWRKCLMDEKCANGEGADDALSGGLARGVGLQPCVVSGYPCADHRGAYPGQTDDAQQSLKRDFGMEKPRIAVLALNPHAGDQGLLGKEEQEIIVPAIDKAKEQGIWAFGPYAADGFFGSGHFAHFDAVLAMYHDQGTDSVQDA